jgi:serine/threonine protein kinase
LFFFSNILFDDRKGLCAITDFGLARRANGPKDLSKIISPRWSAPELINTRLHTKETDVWAFGNNQCFSYILLNFKLF